VTQIEVLIGKKVDAGLPGQKRSQILPLEVSKKAICPIHFSSDKQFPKRPSLADLSFKKGQVATLGTGRDPRRNQR